MPHTGGGDEPFSSTGGTSDAEEAADEFGSQDSVDLGDTFGSEDRVSDSAEEAADEFGSQDSVDLGETSGGFDGGGDPTIIPPTPMERSDPAPASAPGGTEPTAPAGDTTTDTAGGTTGTTTRPDPTAESSPLGAAVTGAEAEALVSRALQGGGPIRNLESRDALAAQVGRLTGVDAREATRGVGDDAVDVALGETGFRLSSPLASRTRRRRRAGGGPTPIDPALQDDPFSAEQAQDLAAQGRITVTPVGGGFQDAPLSADQAQDLAAAGLLTAQARGRRRGRPTLDDAAERSQDRFAALNAEDIRNDPAEAAQDEAARTAAREEQFGDIDFSAGLGDPEVDEVEQFTDETLPGAIGGAAASIGLDEVREATTDTDRTTVSPTGFSPAAGGARFTESLFQLGEGLARAPATALEGVETANYLSEPLVTSPTGLLLGGDEVPDTDAATVRAEKTSAAAELAGEAAVEQARDDPQGTAASLFVELGVEAGAGLALGRGLRAARRFKRTAGATDVAPTEFTRQEVIDANAPGVDDGGETFPGFTDPGAAPDTQAESFARQSEEFTPEEVTEQFGGEPPEGAVDAKKALDVEPEGPDGGRGFQAPESDTAEAGAFETVGTSVGPELSPYFFRESGRRQFSIVPGLPDLGESPTAAVIRSDLVETDASDVGEFNEELLAAEEAGDNRFRTLPPDEFDPGEAEAIAPPGAEFVEVTAGGPLSRVLRRVGVGADIATETPGGVRVPVRTFVDPDLDDGPGAGVLDDAGDAPDVDVTDIDPDDPLSVTRTAREIARRRQSRPGTDRPLPLPDTDLGGGRDGGRRRDRERGRDRDRGRGRDRGRDRDREIFREPVGESAATRPTGRDGGRGGRPPTPDRDVTRGGGGDRGGRLPSFDPERDRRGGGGGGGGGGGFLTTATTTTTTTTRETPEFDFDDPDEFGFRAEADFEKRFTQGVAAPDVVASGDLGDLGDVGEPATVEPIDTDLDPVVTETRGDPAAATAGDLAALDDLGVDLEGDL